jgi:hypothetical protein
MYSKRVHSITHLVCVGWSTQSQSIITGLLCVAGARTRTLFNTAGVLLSLSLSQVERILPLFIMMRFLVPRICCSSVHHESYNCTKLVGTCFQVVEEVVIVVHAFKGHAFWHDCYGWMFVCLLKHEISVSK